MALPTLTLKADTQISQRRHTDPPRLWYGAILGSVLIHLFGLGIVSWLIVRQQTSEVSTDPIPVEIVAIAPADSQLNHHELSDRGSVSPSQRSSQVSANAQPLNRQAVVPKSQMPPQNGQSSPTSSGTQGRRSNSTSQSAQQPSVNKQQDKNKPSPWRSAQAQNSPQTPPSPANNTSDSVPTRKPGPPAPPNNKPPSPQNSSPKPPPPPKPQPHQGGGLVATLSVHPDDKCRDCPDANDWAKPLENQKEIGNTQYLSPALKNLKQAVTLEVYLVLDNKGKVLPKYTKVTKVLTGRSNDEVKRQVVKLLNDWKFKPAIQGGKPPEQSDLEVDITIAPHAS